MDDIFNFELPLHDRIKAIVKFGDETTIKRLISLLTISNSSIIKNTLYHLCKFCSDISCVLRLEIALALIDYEKEETEPSEIIGFEALDYVCFSMHKSKEIPFSCKLNAYLILNSGLPNLKRVYLYLYDMLTDSSTTFQFKYKTVKFLVSEREENNITSLMVEYCISVLLSNFHDSSYPKINNETYEDYLQIFILTCQLSLSYVPKLKCSCIAENKLLEICKNQNLSVNIRADASDMLLSYGSSENKEEAKIILDSLSFDNHTIKTIYNNKENVHTSTINKTAINTITIIIEDVNKMFQREDIWILTENILQNLIEKYPPNFKPQIKSQIDNAIKAYNRIMYLDNALYTAYNFNLKNIMNYVWTFINNSNKVSNKVELEKRLIEEMREMNNTCSSGYLTRFANIFSGFLENGGVFIGWDEQILSIFYGKVNSAITSSLNKDLILENLIETENENDKQEFQKLLRTILPNIIESIKIEFKDHISESDIDLYIRRALSVFEGHEFI
ncbi:467R [Invertebrate iridescent virus 6]|uniref:Uncharacterized protein 467R n=1 Tax=Invertebrate iridescent virus 6 TaxID=176652 RepID=VF467_IIV6|nr:467R [Invertebrate iridescent virus 6]Q91F59.1 RecName: Full=Uncharacterized protein 467R [Invertebrate iridescent virus 6]AAK82327.1 467R [Invertebrate iridescent virus 6]